MTQKLVLTRGLPGSGKTTRALAWLTEGSHNRARVNRDVLREHVFGVMPMLDSLGERDVTFLQTEMVRSLLLQGRDVVIDDTNLPDLTVDRWRELAAYMGVEVEVWDLRDVPVDVCIERDRARGAAGGRLVGADIIRDIARRGAPTTPVETTSEKG